MIVYKVEIFHFFTPSGDCTCRGLGDLSASHIVPSGRDVQKPPGLAVPGNVDVTIIKLQ